MHFSTSLNGMHIEILQGNAEFWTIIIELYSAQENWICEKPYCQLT